MSNVIQFLEAMGRRPALKPGQYAAAVASLELDARQRKALLERDGDGLNRALGGSETRCLIYVPD